MTAFGWLAALVVLIGVLTAWMEPPATGLIHASALVLGGVSVLYSLARRVRIAGHWLIAIPLACAGWGALQIFTRWSSQPFQTWNLTTNWLALAALFGIGYAGFQNHNAFSRLRTATIWFGGFYSLIAIVQWYSGGGAILWLIQTPYESGIMGTFANRDQYAVLMELLLPLALFGSIQRSRFAYASLACAGLMFSSVLVCGSRAGTAIVIVEAMIFVASVCLGRQRNPRTAGLILATFLAFTLVAGWTHIWERFASGNYFDARRELLTSTVSMFNSRPWTGFGLGSWANIYPGFAVFDPPGVYMNHAHNDWAEWAAEGGIPFVAILAIFGCMGALNARSKLWTIGIPAVLIHALVDFPLQKPALSCALFFFAGVAFVARRVNESNPATGSDNFEPQSL